MKNKRPLILFSGGTDSTLLLLNTLKHTNVDIVSVSGVINDLKAEKEEEAREKILNILSKRKLPYNVKNRFHIKLNIEHNNHTLAIQQFHHWLYALACRTDSSIHSHVYLGYLMGDDISIFRHEITECWNNLSKIVHPVPIPLQLPLIYYRKRNVIESLEETDPEIAKLVWFCEDPIERKTRSGKKTIVKCNKCQPCIVNRMNRELIASK